MTWRTRRHEYLNGKAAIAPRQIERADPVSPDRAIQASIVRNSDPPNSTTISLKEWKAERAQASVRNGDPAGAVAEMSEDLDGTMVFSDAVCGDAA